MQPQFGDQELENKRCRDEQMVFLLTVCSSSCQSGPSERPVVRYFDQQEAALSRNGEN